MSWPVGKNQKECPYCCEYGIDKNIEFIKREELIFLFKGFFMNLLDASVDGVMEKFEVLKKKYKIDLEVID